MQQVIPPPIESSLRSLSPVFFEQYRMIPEKVYQRLIWIERMARARARKR